MVWVIENVVELVGRFADVALADPISLVLVVMGALLVGAASAVMAYLTLGALLKALRPDFTRAPPQ